MSAQGSLLRSESMTSMQQLVSSLSTIVAAQCEGLQGVPALEARCSSSSENDACCPDSSLKCIEWLLKKPDNAYRFCPGNHRAFVERRPSFKELVSNWNHAPLSTKKDNGSFPDVRGKKSNDCFADCILRCQCQACEARGEGKAVAIECEPYAFGRAGEVILVHQFLFDNKIWAMILGSWSSPDEYRVWGSWHKDPSVTNYNECVLLREDFNTKPTGASKRFRQMVKKPDDGAPKSTRTTTSRKKKRTSKTAASNQHSCDNWILHCDDNGDDDEEISKREVFESRYSRPTSTDAPGVVSMSTKSALSQRRPTIVQNHDLRNHHVASGVGAMQAPSQRDYFQSHDDQFEAMGDFDIGTSSNNTSRNIALKHNKIPKVQPRVCAAKLCESNPAEVYCFYPNDHNARAFSKRSLNQLIADWSNAPQHTKDDYISFPEIRGRGALVREAFKDCFIRCVCNNCTKSGAALLRCKPYQFGKQQIFVHEFDRDGDTLAFILGSWSEQEYRLWGAYDVDLETGLGYYKTVHLELVAPGDIEVAKVAKERPTEDKTPATAEGKSRKPDSSLQDQYAGDEAESHNPIHQASQATENVQFQRPQSPRAQHDTTSGEPTSKANLTNANDRGSISAPPSSAATPSAALYLPYSNPFLCEAYDDAEAHVIDLRDSSGNLVMDFNEQLADHLKRLKTAADNDDEDIFGMMWRAVNRDLAKAGLDCLPV